MKRGKKRDLADSANVFNDSPIEDPMAIEPAPVEINLRDPRKGGRDFSALLWLCGWGVATAVAQMPPRVTQLELETQMLIEQVRALKADRDRLAGRVALLESSVDDMTGTIKRQAAATAAALAARTTAISPQPGAAPAAASATPAAVAAPEAKTDPVITASVPLPPGRASAAQASAEPDTQAARSNAFGLDLGGASTLNGVRERWMTVKAGFGPLLSGLHPLAAPERRKGKAGYRLVVGPLPNSPAATGLCAHFNAAHTPCRAVKFEGEQIAQR
jgi:hypothetical protein